MPNKPEVVVCFSLQSNYLQLFEKLTEVRIIQMRQWMIIIIDTCFNFVTGCKIEFYKCHG